MNIVFISAAQDGMSRDEHHHSHNTMRAQLAMLGLEFYLTNGWYEEVFKQSCMVCYRTDHELQQVKRLAAAHNQNSIMVLENIRVLPEGTIAQGGLEYYTRPADGYYQGEHSEQHIEFHALQPAGDCTQLPHHMGGLYITIKGE